MRKLLFLTGFLFLAVSISAQNYIFRHLGTAEGLLSDLRLIMTEDRQGRLWIGSDEGINVFDGYRLLSYSVPDKSGLANNNVQRIFSDMHGTIWIWTEFGIQFKKEKDSRFRMLEAQDTIKGAPWFAETTDGRLCLWASNGIFFIDKDLRITHSIKLTNALKKYRGAICLEPFKADQWFLGFASKLVLVDLAKETLLKEVDFTHAWAVSRLSDSTIMTGSFVKDTVVIANLNTGRIEPINDWLSSDGIRMGGYAATILPIGPNKWVVGCRYDGIYVVDIKEKRLLHLTHDPGDPFSIKSRFCRRIFITRDGTMFVHARSLSYTQLKPMQFKTVRTLVNEKGEKYDGGFFSFVKDDEGRYWISTGGHLALWDRKTGISHYYPYYTPEGGPQKFKTVRDVAKDRLNRIWVATFGGGLGMLLPDGSFEQYHRRAADAANTVPSMIMLSMSHDTAQNLLLSTNAGFGLFDPIAKKAKNYDDHPQLKKICRKLTNGIFADAQDNWWIAQLDGFYFWDRAADSLYHIEQPSYVRDRQMNTFCTDRLGNVYAGGWSGLYVIPAGSKKIKKHLSKLDGLSSDNVETLICDNQGKIWIIGNIGVARYDPVSGKMQTFDARDGLEQSNHPLSSAYLAPDGEMFIASSEGFNYFYPDSIHNEVTPLKVFVTSLELRDTVISLPELNNEKFRSFQNNLTFSFHTVDFKLAPVIQYRYRLDGFDTAFNYAGTQRSARYTNLPAGKYSFIVEASPNGKDWYRCQQNLDFQIRKALWQTWWFRLLLFSLIAGLIYLYYTNRVKQINKEARLRSDYEIKLNELENSALRTQMNPHFIFNSLNTINSFINSNERTQANQYISKFSKLVRLILDHSRQKRISLKDEIEVAELYMQLEQIRFENRFRYSVTMQEVDPQVTEVPPLIIQPFVENAILHGLLPLDKEGLLKVDIRLINGLLQCNIEDNGIGREAAKEIKAKSGFQRRSHGMEITLKRIELFNRENGVKEPVRIIDMKDGSGAVTGTRVEIPLAHIEAF